MIIFTKLFAVFLAILVISKTLHDYRKRLEPFATFLFWTIAWLGIVYVTLRPELFFAFTQSLANKNVGMGTLVGLAFVFLFYITYRVYVKAHRLERKLRDIVIEIGLRDIDE